MCSGLYTAAVTTVAALAENANLGKHKGSAEVQLFSGRKAHLSSAAVTLLPSSRKVGSTSSNIAYLDDWRRSQLEWHNPCMI